METYAGIKFTTALSRTTAVLAGAFLTILSTGCAAQTGGRVSAMPKAVTPITIEMTQAGDIVNAIDANGKVLPKRDPPIATQAYFTEGERRYLFGTGTIADPVNRSAAIPARCLGEEGKSWRCWPGDRSVWMEVTRKGIQRLWYVADDGKSVHTTRPVGAAPTQTPGKEIWFGQLPQAAPKLYQGVLPRDVLDCICCSCFGEVCYDGPPCT